MEVFNRRSALVGIAGAVLGFVPSHANAQYIMSGKEKAGKKKGPRFVDVFLVPFFSLRCKNAFVSIVCLAGWCDPRAGRLSFVRAFVCVECMVRV